MWMNMDLNVLVLQTACQVCNLPGIGPFQTPARGSQLDCGRTKILLQSVGSV